MKLYSFLLQIVLTSEKQIKRIVHQIDQRCRDVVPRASEGLGGKPSIEVPEIA